MTKALSIFKNDMLRTDWTLLFFLVFFLNVKLGVKLACLLVVLFFIRKSFKGRSFRKQPYSWFYVSMITIGLLNLLLNISSINLPVLAVFLTGSLYWMMALAAAAICFHFTQKLSPQKLDQTISLFFILNLVFSFTDLLSIMIQTGSLNPFAYEGMDNKYSINTGDYIRGISLDISTTNAVISAFGVFYFLFRNRFILSILCMACMVITASNLTILMMLIISLLALLFHSGKLQKSILCINICVLAIFLTSISPENTRYIKYSSTRLSGAIFASPTSSPPSRTSFISEDEWRNRIARRHIDSSFVAKELLTEKDPERIQLLKAAMREFQTMPVSRSVKAKDPLPDTPVLSGSLFSYDPLKKDQYLQQEMAGKLISLYETVYLFISHPEKIFLGNGMGHFSSRLAFRTAGIKEAGYYPEKLLYTDSFFRRNHLLTYQYYFSQDKSQHSVKNSPHSFYLQLAGEYGLAGIVVFILFYIGYFLKNYQRLSYGWALLPLFLFILSIEYWFEQLSIVVLFELLLLSDRRLSVHPNQEQGTI